MAGLFYVSDAKNVAIKLPGEVEYNVLCTLQLRAEMNELYLQRDRAQARLDEVLKKIEEEEAAKALVFLLFSLSCYKLFFFEELSS